MHRLLFILCCLAACGDNLTEPPPNLPYDMEFLDWNDGGVPCTDWQDLVDGESVGRCGEDSSLLLVWRFPNGTGAVPPGGTFMADGTARSSKSGRGMRNRRR